MTTVVNTFGGTWFTADWQPQVSSPEFTKAVTFYVDLIKAHGEPGAGQAGFTECLTAMSQNKVAMWYDATSAAGSLEDSALSKVAGKVGYAGFGQALAASKAAVGVGLGHADDHEEVRRGLEVHPLVDQQGLREAGRREAGLAAGAVWQACVDVLDPRVQDGRCRVR